jgi:hypothetical protein
MKKIFSRINICFLLTTFLFWPFFAYAYQGTVQSDYPKLANYYTKWVLSESDVAPLSKWDVLLLDPQTQENSANILREIRQKNPQIIILARVAVEEINNSPDNTIGFKGGSVRNDLLQQLSDNWFLRDKNGNKLSFWAGTNLMNLTDGSGQANGLRWNEFLPQFVKSRIISTGLWDGVFYDNVWPTISFFNNGNLDVDNNKTIKSKAQIDQEWLAGNIKLLNRTQQLLGGGYLVVANGRASNSYQPYLNGIMLENFPSSYEGDGTWAGSIKAYLNDKNFLTPKVSIVNANTNNTWNMQNYHKMRFSLGSTLLSDGYFSFDYGDQNHQQTWWYDEYQTALGKPVSAPINILDKNSGVIKKGLWRRDFENGIVVVNSTSQTQNYEFTNEVFTKISGTQDSTVNNGSRINLVSIAAQDAVVLLGDLASRKVPTGILATTVAPTVNTATPASTVSSGKTTENIITNAVFKNGVFFRAFDQSGNQKRSGFFAYDGRYPGGAQVISADIDNDKINETIVNNKGVITIYRGTKILSSFKPFDSLFKGDISLAIANLNGNGQKQLVIGAGKGGGPQIRIFNTNGRLLSGGFFAYDRNFRGGVNVATIDINNDGKDEIVTGAGVGGGPQVRIFNQNGKVLGGFFAYDKNSRFGVTVAAGNLNGNSDRQIITGTGPGVQPQVRVWDKFGKLISQFFAYDKTVAGGITVGAADINGDGKDEVLAGSTAY